MSESFRQRLRRRLKNIELKYNLSPKDLEWVEPYIEELCAESDRQCKKIDPFKAVDQVIDELDDEAFDKFAKGVLDDVKARIEKSKKLQKKKRKNVIEESDDYQPAEPYVYPNENTVTEHVSQNTQEIPAK